MSYWLSTTSYITQKIDSRGLKKISRVLLWYRLSGTTSMYSKIASTRLLLTSCIGMPHWKQELQSTVQTCRGLKKLANNVRTPSAWKDSLRVAAHPLPPQGNARDLLVYSREKREIWYGILLFGPRCCGLVQTAWGLIWYSKCLEPDVVGSNPREKREVWYGLFDVQELIS